MRISLSLAAALTLLSVLAAADAPRPLSDAQLDALCDGLTRKIGTENHPGAEMLGALGLPPGPEPGGYGPVWYGREFKTEDGILHDFATRPDRPDYLFTRWTKDDIQYIRTDADLNFIADARYKRSDDRARDVPLPRAVETLNQEIALWAAYADAHPLKRP